MSLVKPSEFARICGVNRSTVTRWIQNGRIELAENGLIDSDQAAKMREETESPMPHHQARKAQFDEARVSADTDRAKQIDPDAKAKAAADKKQASESSNVSTQLKLETWRLQKAKAEMAALEVDKMAGTLVERSEVDFVLAEFGNTLRGLLEGMPDRLAGQISAHRGDTAKIHKDLEDAAFDLLSEISQLIQRKTGVPDVA
jgi:phage terminase Nu1 subunit (DNA packaging protein)